MNIENMTNENGNKVKNQFIIKEASGNVFFKSYDVLIVQKCINGRLLLDKKYWDFSKTTRKYRNLFLGMDSETVKKKIANGDIELVSLN